MTAEVKMHPAKRRRQAELRELAAMMRQPGSLAALPPATPLHKMADTTTADITTSATTRG